MTTFSEKQSLFFDSGSQPDVARGFKSFKTPIAIPYPCRWHRDFLIQATLDPAIAAINPHECGPHERFSIAVNTKSSTHVLTAVRDRSHVVDENSHHTLNLITRSFVLAEPRCSTARAIWAARATQVAPRDRINILRMLGEQSDGVCLAAASDRITDHSIDAIQSIFALVCAGQIEIDISTPLSPDTHIRLRSIS